MLNKLMVLILFIATISTCLQHQSSSTMFGKAVSSNRLELNKYFAYQDIVSFPVLKYKRKLL